MTISFLKYLVSRKTGEIMRRRVDLSKYQERPHPTLKLGEVNEEEVEKKLFEAGQVAKEILQALKEMVKPGIKVLDLCLAADKMIKEKGLKPSFPLNVSINHVAAHYTSPPDDQLVIQKGDVVKLDLGTHVDGFIADTALTVDLGKNPDLVKASIEATEAATDLIRPGTNTRDLGAIIEDIITGYDLRPIVNLSGHLVERYVVHGHKTVPLTGKKGGDIVEEGDIFAIETFASTGSGEIRADPTRINIFRASSFPVKIRSTAARKVYKVAAEEFSGLPFAERWLYDHLSKREILLGMRELRRVEGIIGYNVLVETDKEALVSQHEHTMIITSDGAKVTTL